MGYGQKTYICFNILSSLICIDNIHIFIVLLDPPKSHASPVWHVNDHLHIFLPD